MAALSVLNLYAQKRNNVKICATYDNLYGSDIYSVKSYSNKFGYAIAYDRYVGSNITIGVFGNLYFSSKNTIEGFSDEYSPANYSNSQFMLCDFTQSSYLVGYESKYYFESFDDDGPNSAYLGISIQTGTFNQQLANVKYRNTTNNYTDESKTFNDQSFTVNRIGLKYGRAFSSIVSGDFYVSLMYNIPGNTANQQFASPTFVRSLSIGIGYAIGVPF